MRSNCFQQSLEKCRGYEYGDVIVMEKAERIWAAELEEGRKPVLSRLEDLRQLASALDTLHLRYGKPSLALLLLLRRSSQLCIAQEFSCLCYAQRVA